MCYKNTMHLQHYTKIRIMITIRLSVALMIRHWYSKTIIYLFNPAVFICEILLYYVLMFRKGV